MPMKINNEGEPLRDVEETIEQLKTNKDSITKTLGLAEDASWEDIVAEAKKLEENDDVAQLYDERSSEAA